MGETEGYTVPGETLVIKSQVNVQFTVRPVVDVTRLFTVEGNWAENGTEKLEEFAVTYS